MEGKRIFILIDGSNFYHRLKELRLSRSLLNFDYNSFVNWIIGERTLVEKKYYVGAVRAKPDDIKGQTLRKNQQRLFSKLVNGGWGIERGYILNSLDGRHEKGVDVHIAVDLLVGAYEDLYDTAVLLSSDTDLIPALEKAREKGKQIEYVGFSHKPSYGLITHSDIRRLLTKEEMLRFI